MLDDKQPGMKRRPMSWRPAAALAAFCLVAAVVCALAHVWLALATFVLVGTSWTLNAWAFRKREIRTEKARGHIT